MQVRYYVDDRNRLVSERRVLRDGQDTLPNVIVLLRGVAQLQFEYIGNNGHVETWTELGHLPPLVNIGLNFTKRGYLSWPTLPTLLATAQ